MRSPQPDLRMDGVELGISLKSAFDSHEFGCFGMWSVASLEFDQHAGFLYFSSSLHKTQMGEKPLEVILSSCEKALILEPRIYHISPL